MKQLLIAAAFLGWITGCTTEPSAPSATDSEADQELSAPPISPRSCPVPWQGPGNYYVCDATGVIQHDPAVCRASCNNTPCELIWRCSDNCTLCIAF